MPVIYLRYTLGMPEKYIIEIYPRYMRDYTVDIPEIYLGYSRDIHKISTRYAREIPEMYAKYN